MFRGTATLQTCTRARKASHRAMGLPLGGTWTPNPSSLVRFQVGLLWGVRWGGAVLRKYRATSPILVLSTMTKTQIITVAQRYISIVESATGVVDVKRLNESKATLNVGLLDSHDVASHLRWMCQKIGEIVRDDEIEKAMRWLGFLQGALWVLSFRTIEQMKHDNMPPDEKFDADRV